MNGNFWGYDADDRSNDVYDYESDDMPPGCLLDNKDAPLESTSSHSPAPSPEALSEQNAALADSQDYLLTNCRSLTCRPLAARPPPPCITSTLPRMVAAAIFAVVTGSVLIVMVSALTIFRAECAATATALQAWAVKSASVESTRNSAVNAYDAA